MYSFSFLCGLMPLVFQRLVCSLSQVVLAFAVFCLSQDDWMVAFRDSAVKIGKLGHHVQSLAFDFDVRLSAWFTQGRLRQYFSLLCAQGEAKVLCSQ